MMSLEHVLTRMDSVGVRRLKGPSSAGVGEGWLLRGDLC